MKIYVGNMSEDTTREDLERAFNKYGKVDSVEVVKDWETHKSTGVGFIKMRTKEDGQKAVDALNGTELKGAVLEVHTAHSESHGPGNKPDHHNDKMHFGGNRHGFDTGRSGKRGDR